MKTTDRFDAVETTGNYSGVPTKIKDHPLRYKVVNMTPPFAERLVAKLHPKQRRPKPRKIAMFSAEMEADRWRLSPQPIIIDEDGFVCDGQNRLFAVLKSRKVVPMVICYGAPRGSAVTYDTGTPRTVNDAAGFAGIEVPHNQASGVARRMAAGLNSAVSTYTTQQVLDFTSSYADGISFSFSKFGGSGRASGILTASTRAVIARAYYSGNRERLKLFGDFLVTGLPDSAKTDAAVITLRNWLMSLDKAGHASRANRKDAYAYTEHALANFLKGSRVSQLVYPSEEQFPLPDLRRFDAA